MDGHSRLVLVLFCAFLFTACGTKSKDESGPTRWVSLPVVIYADPGISSNTAAQADLNTAMSFWNSRAGKQLFDYKGAWTGQTPPYTGNPNQPDSLLGNVIYFEHNWPFSTNIAAQTITFSQKNQLLSSVIMLNGTMSLCTGTCTGGTSELRVMAHELGHFLGLAHSQNTADIMYPEVQSGSSLDSLQVDTATLSQLTR
ncbi:MAG: matrixin family metalloprotease [Bdellovibrionota bacterium]